MNIPNHAAAARGEILSDDARNALRMIGRATIEIAETGILPADFADKGIQEVGTARPADRSRLLTIPEACTALRLSRWSVYQLLHRRDLASIKIGRRRFVTAAEIERYVGQLTSVGSYR